MNIQARFDLETTEELLAPQIKKIVSYEAARERCKSHVPIDSLTPGAGAVRTRRAPKGALSQRNECQDADLLRR